MSSRELEYALAVAEAVYNSGRWPGEEEFKDLPAKTKAILANDYIGVAKAVIVKADKEIEEARGLALDDGIRLGWVSGRAYENRTW